MRLLDARIERAEPGSGAGEHWRYAAVCLILLGFGVCLWPVLSPRGNRLWLHRAAQAFAAEDFHAAEAHARHVLQSDSNSILALVIAGSAAARLHENGRAIEYFKQVPVKTSRESVLGLVGLAERQLRTGLASAAEQGLQRALNIDPANESANRLLMVLLQSQGRNWESLKFAARLVRQGQFTGDELLVLGTTERMFILSPDLVRECQAAVPDDPLPWLGDARRDLLENRVQDARSILKRVVRVHPEIAEARARLGQALLDGGSKSEFRDWLQSLPKSSESHPEVWYVLGRWARQEGMPAAALRCFFETLDRNPQHVGATFQAAQLLQEIGNTNLGASLVTLRERLTDRSLHLAKLELLISEASRSPTAARLQPVVNELEKLGRFWEVAATCARVLLMHPRTGWASAGLARYRLHLASSAESLSYFNDSAQPLISREVRESFPLPQSFPLHQWGVPSLAPAPPTSGLTGSIPAVAANPVTFEESSAATGLRFQYDIGPKRAAGDEYLVQFSGGGIGIVDYDGDGWPDIYLAQGGPWPPSPTNRRNDALFRNLGNGHFAEVTGAAGILEEAYSQGVTVGDYDNDGFPDIYVGNIGPNHCFHNNGDGTFADVTERTGTSGNDWTTSCVLADLNGDTWPDLYTVNFLTGSDVLEHACERGNPLTCSPTLYQAAQDRVYLSQGDGTFRDVSGAAAIIRPDGKGLGVVAADLDGSRRLSLFIANDTTANFYFQNEGERGGPLIFSEQGVGRGLAFDAEGQPQACMGIAAGDANGDNRLDLFVTNYHNESNTLYLQTSPGVFVDGTRAAGLRDPGFPMLGFGTQFIDGELDGWLDLVVTNGHVYDLRAQGIPLQMRPQYYRNTGEGRFVELAAESLGPFFEERHLGRALARLDWNRDGREDFCVMHIGESAALLTNTTKPAGHFLAVQLRGIVGDRDAIGAVLQVSAGNRSRMQQMTAGDGYEVSNERRLVFGLGDADHVERLRITWPSGTEQIFTDLPADVEVLFVEGRTRPYVMPRMPSDHE